MHPLTMILVEERRGDLRTDWEEIQPKGKARERVRNGIPALEHIDYLVQTTSREIGPDEDALDDSSRATYHRSNRQSTSMLQKRLINGHG